MHFAKVFFIRHWCSTAHHMFSQRLNFELPGARTYSQFGCGISKMVGPKKQDFWPRINILEGFFLNPLNYGSLKILYILSWL